MKNGDNVKKNYEKMIEKSKNEKRTKMNKRSSESNSKATKTGVKKQKQQQKQRQRSEKQKQRKRKRNKGLRQTIMFRAHHHTVGPHSWDPSRLVVDHQMAKAYHNASA